MVVVVLVVLPEVAIELRGSDVTEPRSSGGSSHTGSNSSGCSSI